MASVGKRSSTRGTPSRTKRSNAQQQQNFFDVGKVGRITGITLADTGIRDEHGLEPMDRIFSSPASPQRSARKTAAGDILHENSASTINATRNLPRLPPPRASTPKHTNIGSPKRMSTGRSKHHRESDFIEANVSPTRPKSQPPNRVLDFGPEVVHSTIETTNSPFRAKNSLRRSVGGVGGVGRRRTGVFDSPGVDEREQDHTKGFEVESANDSGIGNSHDEIHDPTTVDAPAVDDDGPVMGLDDDDYDGPGFAEDSGMSPEEEQRQEDEQEEEVQVSQPVKSRRSMRKSGVSLDDSLVSQGSSTQSAGKKRRREAQEGDISQLGISGSVSTKKRRSDVRPEIDEGNDDQNDDEIPDDMIDPALLEAESSNLTNAEEEPSAASEPEPEAAPKGKRGRPSKKSAAAKKAATSKTTANPQRRSVALKDDSQAPHPNNNGVRASVGPSSNFRLRAMTPFDDAKATTRSGRAVREPLKWWAQEKMVYKRGVAEGVVRADEVTPESKPKPSRKKSKAAKKKKGARSGARQQRAGDQGQDDEDVSDAESILPDEWEADLGVISGDIADWDTVAQTGNPKSLLHEDLAYAVTSLANSEVGGGSDFRFSKVLTTPYFGAGVMEMPPQGFKRVKNARLNTLAFFVSKGKVMVEVNPPGLGVTNRFAISQGGIFIVPRGNLYSIQNESATTDAVLFFCQGCEVPASAAVADD